MANRIAGITVEIGGDTTKLSAALKSVNSEIRSTQSELKDVRALNGKMPDKYTPGTYTVVSNGLKVRSGAGVQYSKKLYTEMTSDAQKKNPEYAEKGVAAYKKGTRFTAKRIVKVSETEYWAETPSGFVCLMKNGIEYVK